MKLTAHRGLSSLAPENTLAAFELAVQQGAEWIEIDIQLCQEKVPVVIHDQTVNRCTNGNGKVANLTVKELKSLDAGRWFGDAYHGERIPTLAETLRFAQQHPVKLNIELKLYEGDNIDLLCQQVKAVLEEVAIEADQVLFSSFSTDALMTMKHQMPAIRRGQLWQKIPQEAFTVLAEMEAFSVHCDYRFLTESTAKAIKREHYQLYCYTPNCPEQVAAHWHWGVDMMITDVPQNYQKQARATG